MSTQDTFMARSIETRETNLERTTAWAIVFATCLVMVLGPFLTS